MYIMLIIISEYTDIRIFVVLYHHSVSVILSVFYHSTAKTSICIGSQVFQCHVRNM